MRASPVRSARSTVAASVLVLVLGSHLACNSIAGLNDLSFTASDPEEPICEPFATKSCYHGPEGTEGIGPCKAGIQTCFPDGSAYGLCDGEVLPSAEVCGNPIDEDCSGAPDNGCPCEPGAKQSCYTGPEGTVNVGLCKAGVQICLDDGTSYGPCEDEVVPTAESCSTPEDDDCDGSSACGAPTTTFTAGDAARQQLFAIDAGPNGEIAFAGSHVGTLSLGNFTLDAGVNASDAFVAVRDGQQGFALGLGFGDPAFTDVTEGVAVSPQGDLLITGSVSGPVDFGNGQLVPSGFVNSDIFVARFDASGQALWSFLFGDNNDQTGRRVAVSPTENIFLAGNFSGDVDFGGGVVAPGAGNQDAFLTAFSPEGVASWAVTATGQKDQVVMDLAVTPTGEAVLAISAAADVVIEGVTHQVQQDDVVLVKVQDTGDVAWVAVAGDVSPQVPNAVTVTSGGDIVVVGEMQGAMVLGGCTITATNGIDAFVAQLTANGSCTWAKVYAAANAQRATAVATDSVGNIIVAGIFQGSVDFGDGQMVTSDGVDVFILALDPSGATVWKQILSGSGNAYATDVAVASSGSITVGGYFDGDLDFGDGAGPITSQGDRDLFLVDLSP